MRSHLGILIMFCQFILFSPTTEAKVYEITFRFIDNVLSIYII